MLHGTGPASVAEAGGVQRKAPKALTVGHASQAWQQISAIRLPFDFLSSFETHPLHCDHLAQGALIRCSAYLYLTLMQR